MKKIFFPLFLFLFLFTTVARAGEGMWLPLLLQQLNEKEMRTMGMRITAEDIYSINKSSLKDAIVQFGGGCTGELVSNQGLLLTNHHCGYGEIQNHSTLEHDYLRYGFWAQSLQEELPNPGLTVTFLIRMDDVTKSVLKGVTDKMTQAERTKKINANIDIIAANAVKGTGYEAYIKPFYNGNQYYMFTTETFKDVRLVGAPPSNIGKFGGDTDNWMWPRHTGDFSVFRIYADKNNKPAPYSKDNVPYKPKKALTISLKGIQENDFTFVYGYPGRTQEYIPSYAVDMFANKQNPVAIGLRQQRLDIIGNAMNADKLTRIQYSSKAAGISNAWKKWIGETKGINRLKAVEKKQAFENAFQQWAKTNTSFNGKYEQLLPSFKNNYEKLVPVQIANVYINEALLAPEIIRFAYRFNKLINAAAQSLNNAETLKEIADQKAYVAEYFKDYNVQVDKKIFNATYNTYIKKAEASLQPPVINEIMSKNGGNIEKWADELYGKSVFTNADEINKLLNDADAKKIAQLAYDPAYVLAKGIMEYQKNDIMPRLNVINAVNDSLQRLYMAGQMDYQPKKTFYPDANFTLRVGYGKVKGFYPYDGVYYNWFTTLDGIMDKENPDIYDYVVEPKLKELYKNEDYGCYADKKDKKMHVAFIATNHTTGGNSGSPVFNADGHLIGLNFDRVWEGTMSDMMYDPDMCRNITLDIRYCLFIIDKFAGAKRLINEMNIAK